MKLFIHIDLMLMLLITGRSTASEYSTLLTSEHNRYRRSEGAVNMKIIVWSNQLESEATTWASRCKNGHQNNGRGENIAMLSVGEDISQLVRQGVKMWYDEKNNYSSGMGFNAGTAHHTQVVWADSNKLGCGVQICEPGPGFYMKYMYLVCFYDPPGNFNNREPYIRGTPCSQCNTQNCDQGLCTGFMGNGLSTRKIDTHLTNKKIQSKDRKEIRSWNTGRNENHGVLNTWKWNSSQRDKSWVWNDARTIASPNRRNSIPKNSGVKFENQNNGFLFGLDTGSSSMSQNRKGGSSWSWSYSWE